MRLVLTGGIPLFATIFVLADLLLRLWLRGRFVDTLPAAFRVMLVGSLISLIGVPAYYTHMGAGRVRNCFISLSIQSLLSAAIVVAYSILAPAMLSEHIFYAVVAGILGSTVFLVWRLWSSKFVSGSDKCTKAALKGTKDSSNNP
jgi:O-antigen/teichoic acid export membrane protein